MNPSKRILSSQVTTCMDGWPITSKLTLTFLKTLRVQRWRLTLVKVDAHKCIHSGEVVVWHATILTKDKDHNFVDDGKESEVKQ